jgi:hypothetical protein
VSPKTSPLRYSLPLTAAGYLSSYTSLLHLASLKLLLPRLPTSSTSLLPLACRSLSAAYLLDSALYPSLPSPFPYLLLLQPLYTAIYLVAKITASSASLKSTSSPATLLSLLDLGQNCVGVLVPILRVHLLRQLGALEDEGRQAEVWVSVAAAVWLVVGGVLFAFGRIGGVEKMGAKVKGE